MKIERDLVETQLVVQFVQAAPACGRRADHGAPFQFVGHGLREIDEQLDRVPGSGLGQQFGRDHAREQVRVRARDLAPFADGDVVVPVDEQPEDARRARGGVAMLS